MMRGRSLRARMTLVVMSTTLAALLISAVSLLVYELRSFRSAAIADLRTQAELIAASAGPALEFDDAKAAGQALDVLRLRPMIHRAAIYDADGRLYVTYTAPDVAADFPAPQPSGYRLRGDALELFQPVQRGGERLGTVFLRARYDLVGRLVDYLAILALVTVASLAIVALVFSRLQDSVTGPILALAPLVGEMMQKRNYGLRLPKTADDEVGELVDAFNRMMGDLAAEMSERHRAEEALREADRRKDEFLATLAHELRNPLAPLATALELLKRPDATPALAQQARGIMDRQLRQMVRLIDDLIDVSRITTGKLVLHAERIDLLDVLRGAVEIAEPSMRSRRHVLTVRLPTAPVWVEADAARLAQVFGNLLNNAAKYTPPGGKVEVDVATTAAEATVRITDNGQGIAPEMQRRIFEMFMQVDQSLERGRAGLGVGLTLARQLAELHGGRVVVHSAGLGQGSCFEVVLPCAEAPAMAGVPGGPGRDAEPAADAALKVLVADDNVDFAVGLTTLLRSLGHHTVAVHDGQAAVAAATSAQTPFDVALLDIGMPVINGFDVAQRLREHPATQALPLVAITGWGQPGDRLRAREAGFDHHLVKPVALDELVKVLRLCTRREGVERTPAA